KIKKMAEAFYGRVAAYDEVMDDGKDKLTSVIHRNLFAEAEGDDNLVRAGELATYMTNMDIFLSQLPLNQLLSRDIFLFDNEPR
ncbi:MAG: ubiquinol-cytochrome C chaperone family protein, partial [Pseudomonadota bacterium]|nr:ubiquinol-cytochrome C chaperone family protein [Pseudomonadota bacterium]